MPCDMALYEPLFFNMPKKDNNTAQITSKKKEDQTEAFLYEFETYRNLTTKKQSYIRAAFGIKYYTVVDTIKVAGVSRTAVYNWLTETNAEYDPEFKALLAEILVYRENERLEEKNALKDEIGIESLRMLRDVISFINP